jgi:phosphomevalonate kinase
MVKVSAPGKLFLSGEWAVLEVGNPGIVTAVNKRVFAEVREAERISVSIDDFGLKNLGAAFDGNRLEWERPLTDKEKEQVQFIKGSIETALKYLGGGAANKTFSIRSWGEESQIVVDGAARKIGFGSSAASVVAVIAGILALNGHEMGSKEARDRIYKLSAIAHYFAQGKVGSAFDVAASTYGGVFVYKRFDPKWLMDELNSGAGVRDVADQEWPAFMAEPLDIPGGFRLLVGWTKESASTSAMVKQLDAWAATNREDYKRLYDSIANLVRKLIPAWKDKNKEMILELVRKNEDYLRELGQASGVNIETPDLKMLSDAANNAGGAGKLSGAGGGDCGIAVCFDSATAKGVKKAWEKAGLYMVDATIDCDGVRAE